MTKAKLTISDDLLRRILNILYIIGAGLWILIIIYVLANSDKLAEIV